MKERKRGLFLWNTVYVHMLSEISHCFGMQFLQGVSIAYDSTFRR